MTPQQRKEAARYLKAFDFSGLFTGSIHRLGLARYGKAPERPGAVAW